MNYLFRHPGRYLLAHWTLTLGLAAALLAPQQGNHAGSAVPTAAGSGETITLVTGQVVQLDAAGRPQPSPQLNLGLVVDRAVPLAPYFWPTGSANSLPPLPINGVAQLDQPTIGANTSVGDALAFPAAVYPALGTFFDPRLFDISYLEANGFDDRSTNVIPVIVRFATHAQAVEAVANGAVDGGILLTQAFEYQPEAMGYVPKTGPFIPATANVDGITAIYLDAHEQADLYESLPLIGVPAARERGLTGAGIKVAIVDTGIDAEHPDLKGRVVAAQDFSGDRNPDDLHGHGTHVAGIVGGSGAASDGKYGGVAPGVTFINAKALNRYGSGSDSGIIKAMEWAADQGARIENLSLGGGPTDGTDPLSQEVNAITRQKGVLFVIAAGNAGRRGSVSTPGAADLALTVGAVNKERGLAPFSSRGPRVRDMAIKPEIVAPGVRITAPRAGHGQDDPYATFSGTSMASPMTAGSAALVFQLHPAWTPQQVKDALISSASSIGDTCEVSPFEQGAGLVNLGGIVSQTAVAEPAALSLGLLKDGRGQGALKLHNISDQKLTVVMASGLCPPATPGGTVEISPAHIILEPGQSQSIGIGFSGFTKPGDYWGEVLFFSGESRVARAVYAFVVK